MWRDEHSLYPYQQKAAETMMEANCLLAYDMGCLAGDTELIVNRGGKSKRMRIDHVVRMFNGGSTSNMRWDLSIPTMVARADGGVARLAQAVNAWESGVKQTFTVTTDSGRTIRATDEHPFLTADGWKRLDELGVGTQVLVNVGKSRRGKSAPKRFYKQTFGMRYHPFRAMWAHRWAVAAHPIVAEAQLNGLDTQVFIDKVKAGEVSGLTFLDPEIYAVHHIDHDHLNNDPSNLEVLTHREHHQRHAAEGKVNHVLDQIGIDVVESVVPFGEEMTYDIEVADDPHCFLANEFVVHNTGKTPTTLYALEQLRADKEFSGPGIILSPASLMWQWSREIEKFTTSTHDVIFGSPKSRGVSYLTASQVDYLIMTYDTFVRDWEKIALIPSNAKGAFGFMVLDEATAIKNFKAKRTKHLKKVGGKFPVRFALTGTPVENGKAEELYSILEWVEPGIVPPWPRFEKEYIIRNSFGWVEGYRNIDKFHKSVRGNMLRKTVHDPEVSKFLPREIKPPPIMVGLDSTTWSVYENIVKSVLDDLDAMVYDLGAKPWSWSPGHDMEDPDHPDGKMMAKIQAARMLLDHPVAVYASAARYADPEDTRGSKYAQQLVNSGLLAKVKTPKFDTFMEYLNEFLDRDSKNKVVVFCSFVDVAVELSNAIPGSVLFHGSMSPKSRDAAKNKFQTLPECRVFVSTDAGGYGLDLPQANLLINYDMPWQAGLLKQRNARIRRASSEWEHVVVQDFVVEGTIEERLMHMLDHKIAVSDAFVDGEGILRDGTLGSSLDSLRSFLSDVHDTVST